MSEDDDPRWQEIRTFLNTASEEMEPSEFLDRWERYTEALDSLAADPTEPPERRAVAQQIVADIAARCREHTAEHLKALGSLRDESQQAEVDAALSNALVKLRDLIDDPATPAEIREQAIEQRRKFWTS